MDKLPPSNDADRQADSHRERERQYVARRTREVDSGPDKRRGSGSQADRTGPALFDFTGTASKLLAPSQINHARAEAEKYQLKPATSGSLRIHKPQHSAQPKSALDEGVTELPAEIQDTIALEQELAREAGAVGYMARLLCQVTMPHRKLAQTELERVNGDLTVTMVSPSKVGLPYGTYPRLIMAHVSTQAVLTQSPRVELGDSLSAYMRRLGLDVTGGRWGSIARMREHLGRLLRCSISCTDERDDSWSGVAFHPVEEARLWWDPKRPEQQDLWQSELVLNRRFYEQIISHPVPIDERVLRQLAETRSPLAIDIYLWLTHRLSYLRAPTRIPWRYLQMQFGGDYKRTRAFKEAFIKQMSAVLIHYPVRVEARPRELWIFPGKTSVARISDGL